MGSLRAVVNDHTICYKCKEAKPLDSFAVSNHPKNTLKRTYQCKCCAKAESALRRETPEGFMNQLWTNLIGNAKRRGIEVHINKQDILDMYNSQEGLCNVTGLPMQKSSNTIQKRNPFAASVDRIDSAGGYTLDNIQMVCGRVNLMKLDGTSEDLEFWCSHIIKGNNE